MKTANQKLRILFFSLGLIISIVPPLISILSFFPLWLGGGSAKVASGFTLLLCFIAHAPLFKVINKILRSGASYLMWLVIFICFFLLEKIAYEMTVISFIGFISNLVGAVFFKLSKRYGGEDEEES